ncbi:methyl-accepting chemotaxis protein [Pseudomonas sp. NA-150]|uniref:methyl-accepting chemotaxis protein n=1 Tax=Pseudomonas sp. NA-150 TaxID=3367525 RepID=UPI0037C517F4
MPVNTSINDSERVFPAEQRLISATDTQGRITYCNDEFVAVSGFTREQLMGAAHNIVRHPDMPAAIYEHMWSHLKAGKPWMGIIKNRCSNGDFCWVSTYVTAIRQEGQVIGYESVRVKPDAEQINRAIALYARLRQGRSATSLGRRLGIFSRFLLVPVLGGLLGTFLFMQGMPQGALAAVITLSFVQTGISLAFVRRALTKIQEAAPQAFDSELVALTYSSESGAVARLQMALISEGARIRTALSRLGDYADQTASLATRNGQLVNQSEAALKVQCVEADMAAAAMHEMAASITQVSAHVHQTAQSALEVNQLSTGGAQQVVQTRRVIEKLADTVDDISHSVDSLAKQTESIQQAASMIQAIAEQTNLLALNAAIEAARAGDQGRGFAVVADEVRALASKTRDSTKFIQQIIGTLQGEAQQAVDIASKGSEEARAGVRHVVDTERALDGITLAVSGIHQRVEQMATATEQQSQVAGSISRQITIISQAAQNNSELTGRSLLLGRDLEATAHSLHLLVERFNA